MLVDEQLRLDLGGTALQEADRQQSPIGMRVQSPSISPVAAAMTSSAAAVKKQKDKTTDIDAAADKKTQDLEIKRRRNREWMRKARLQQRSKIDSMKDDIVQLERELAQLKQRSLSKNDSAVARDDATLSATGGGAVARMDDVASMSSLDRIKLQHAQLLVSAQQLREERNWLRDEVCRYERSMSTVAQLVDEMRVCCTDLTPPPSETTDQQDQSSEHLESQHWVTDSLSTIFTPLPASMVYAIVRQGYAEIMNIVEWADLFEPIGSVLGWTNKRLVRNNHVDFMLTKDFFHERTDDLMGRAWRNETDEACIRLIEPSVRSMKLLQRINDDTFIFARNLKLPHSETMFCTIFVCFRIQTQDGYLFGTRTLQHPNAAELAAVLGSKLVYTDLSYAMMFSRIMAPNPITGLPQEVGCRVKYGGRMGNGTEAYARTMAMNILLLTLRWEHYTVGPLYQLTTE